ncbi:MAG: hypothetical protein DCF22_00170 [Leptolyngbya sp.]|nr:MAG: hypothetical protein DCF22_00170 [Leptolyngbya sp.]
MSAKTPLEGTELVDCARANAKQGSETAAELCGYGSDLNRFKQAVKQACDDMGVQFNELTDLAKEDSSLLEVEGEIVAPDSAGQL